MRFEELPSELVGEIVLSLDYKSLVALCQTSKHFFLYADDYPTWRKLHRRTFSPGRETLRGLAWHDDFARRIIALRELLIRGTNDYRADILRRIFSEMSSENGRLLIEMIEESDIGLSSLLVECQGYAIGNVGRLLPRSVVNEVARFLESNRDRIENDPRSEVHLIRMLLARHTGHHMGAKHIEAFLKSAHLITYNSVEHPLFFYQPFVSDPWTRTPRYHFRSDARNCLMEGANTGPVVNWGVVETIHSLIKLYRDRMGEAIPQFLKSRDDYESEVPMSKEMFDADISGNWRGLYGYLDFRELEVLDSSRAFTPDFFDGLQSLKIQPEEDYDTSRHPLHHGEFMEDDELQVRDAMSDHQQDASNEDEEAFYLSEDDDPKQHFSGDSVKHSKRRFIADGRSVHGTFHIHGSTVRKYPTSSASPHTTLTWTTDIPNMEEGFKLVQFDAMYNSEGLMPWIMEGVHVPSIGIIGRWRDRTEARGTGVEGPYVLWRSRDQDLRDQDAASREGERRRAQGEAVPDRKLAAVRHLQRTHVDLAYIVIEELQAQ